MKISGEESALRIYGKVLAINSNVCRKTREMKYVFLLKGKGRRRLVNPFWEAPRVPPLRNVVAVV